MWYALAGLGTAFGIVIAAYALSPVWLGPLVVDETPDEVLASARTIGRKSNRGQP